MLHTKCSSYWVIIYNWSWKTYTFHELQVDIYLNYWLDIVFYQDQYQIMILYLHKYMVNLDRFCYTFSARIQSNSCFHERSGHRNSVLGKQNRLPILTFSIMMWTSLEKYWNMTFTKLLRNFAKGQKNNNNMKGTSTWRSCYLIMGI